VFQKGSLPAKPDGLTYPLGTRPAQIQTDCPAAPVVVIEFTIDNRLLASGWTARRQGRPKQGEVMFLPNKIGWLGIAFALLTSGMLADFPRRPAGSDSNKEGVPELHQNEIKKMQETLRNKGHHRGKVDGVFGLRTRASIRAYQKAENLPITGQLDTQTAGKLGVTPVGREEAGYETTTGKPSAGIKWAKSSGRTSKALPKAVKTVAAPESGRGNPEKTLQAENENHPQ
jgi:hypothetical protein